MRLQLLQILRALQQGRQQEFLESYSAVAAAHYTAFLPTLLYLYFKHSSLPIRNFLYNLAEQSHFLMTAAQQMICLGLDNQMPQFFKEVQAKKDNPEIGLTLQVFRGLGELGKRLKNQVAKSDWQNFIEEHLHSVNSRIKDSPILYPFVGKDCHRILAFETDTQFFQTKERVLFKLTCVKDQESETKSFQELSQSRKIIFNRSKGGSSFLVKSQSQFKLQILVLNQMKIFKDLLASIGILLFPYDIFPVDRNLALVEFMEGTISLDSIKKDERWAGKLVTFFKQVARQKFVRSLVGYSLFTFFCMVSDRHNANILINSAGAILHIDFGFAFNAFPGKLIKIQRAPFKLTKEYVGVMGGLSSPAFQLFKELLQKGLKQIYDHKELLLATLTLSMVQGIDQLKDQLWTCWQAQQLIDESYNSSFTALYDNFQLKTNGIRP